MDAQEIFAEWVRSFFLHNRCQINLPKAHILHHTTSVQSISSVPPFAELSHENFILEFQIPWERGREKELIVFSNKVPDCIYNLYVKKQVTRDSRTGKITKHWGPIPEESLALIINCKCRKFQCQRDYLGFHQWKTMRSPGHWGADLWNTALNLRHVMNTIAEKETLSAAYWESHHTSTSGRNGRKMNLFLCLREDSGI